MRFSTRDESTRVSTSSPCEVAGLDRDVETEPGIWEMGEACDGTSVGKWLERCFEDIDIDFYSGLVLTL